MRQENGNVVDDSLSESREWFGRTIRDVRANNPNGGAALSTRLAHPAATLGARREVETTPTALLPKPGARVERTGRNRVAVGEVSWPMTQGSSCLATLGIETESRWDSRMLWMIHYRNRENGSGAQSGTCVRTILTGLRP